MYIIVLFLFSNKLLYESKLLQHHLFQIVHLWITSRDKTDVNFRR